MTEQQNDGDHDHADAFSSFSHTSATFENAEEALQHYKQIYHHAELKNTHQTDVGYCSDNFTHDFGKGQHNYRWELQSCFTRSGTKIEIALVKEELSEDEANSLEPFCRCMYHSKSSWNPLRQFVCRCCVGCVTSEFPQQHLIDKARKLKRESEEPNTLTSCLLS